MVPTSSSWSWRLLRPTDERSEYVASIEYFQLKKMANPAYKLSVKNNQQNPTKGEQVEKPTSIFSLNAFAILAR